MGKQGAAVEAGRAHNLQADGSKASTPVQIIFILWLNENKNCSPT